MSYEKQSSIVAQRNKIVHSFSLSVEASQKIKANRKINWSATLSRFIEALEVGEPKEKKGA